MRASPPARYSGIASTTALRSSSRLSPEARHPGRPSIGPTRAVLLVDEHAKLTLAHGSQSRPACRKIAAVRPLLYVLPPWCRSVIGRFPSFSVFTTCFPPLVIRKPLSSRSRRAPCCRAASGARSEAWRAVRVRERRSCGQVSVRRRRRTLDVAGALTFTDENTAQDACSDGTPTLSVQALPTP